MTLVVGMVSMGLAFPVATQAIAQRSYRTSDQQMRQLLRRIGRRTDAFKRSLGRALDRSRLDNTRREDDLNRLVADFEQATNQLRQSFESRQSTESDVHTVLRRAARINTVMERNDAGNRAERDWMWLKNELNQLASVHDVAWNWDAGATNWDDTANTNAPLTGTYQLNASLSNNPRDVVERATRGLNRNQRQRVNERLANRLDPPQMLALERRGNTVSLASSNSPRVTFDVDGREHTERYPDGRTSRVRASFNGDQLSVTSNGDRANDFTATFVPINNGQRLLVTRRVYAERLNQPVVVQSYYDRTSDTAQWNLYDDRRQTQTDTGSSNDRFLVPNGTVLTATLNTDLSTSRTREGDRFRMTVREPSQYAGAVIEGYVSNVDRSGRATGRSEMSLNFERIRTTAGQTSDFAGLIEGVQTAGGETVRVDTEGAVRDDDSQTSRTVQRTAIGTAVGALIGAIAGGGKGAAIGAAVGAGAGAGSVYVQGREDLELKSGSQLTIRSGAPR